MPLELIDDNRYSRIASNIKNNTVFLNEWYAIDLVKNQDGVIVGVIAIFFLPWYDDPQSYTDDYGIEGLFDTLMTVIHWMTAAFGVLTAVLIMVARRIETATPDDPIQDS